MKAHPLSCSVLNYKLTPDCFSPFFVLLRSAVLFTLSLFTHLSHLTQLWPVACLIKLQLPQLPTQPGWLLKTSTDRWFIRLYFVVVPRRSRYAIHDECIRSARVMRQTFSISIVWNRDRCGNCWTLLNSSIILLIWVDYLLFVLNKCLWIIRFRDSLTPS